MGVVGGLKITSYTGHVTTAKNIARDKWERFLMGREEAKAHDRNIIETKNKKMKRFYLTLFVGLLTAVSSMAGVTVLSSDDGTSVTIAVEGDAGQIGQAAAEVWNGYVFTDAIGNDDRQKITLATNITITGKISAVDIRALTCECYDASNSRSFGVEKLDMSGAEIDKIGYYKNGYGNYEMDFVWNSRKMNYLKTLLLPKVTNATELAGDSPFTYAFCPFCSWCPNVESVVIGEGVTAIGDYSFGNCIKLSSVTFPEGLKSIGKGAFTQCSISKITFPNTLEVIDSVAFNNPKSASIETLVFPASLKKIGNQAFALNRVKDVYFLGSSCPEVDDAVFDNASYNGNGGYSSELNSATVAERSMYFNNDYPIAILHLPSNLTEAEKLKFTDVTRSYSINDKYLGEQKKWPNLQEMTKAYNTACNGTLFDGKTSYEQYKGWHKFVLVSYDATEESSSEWDFSKYQQDLWWTIMLPFNMTKGDVKEVFGDGTEVCKFSKVERDATAKKIRLEFKDEQCQVDDKADSATVIEAFHSYMIHPHGTGTNKFAYQTEVENVVATQVTASDGKQYEFIGNHYSQSESGGVVYAPQYSYGLGVKSNGDHALFFHTATNRTWSQWTAVVRQADGGTDYDDFFKKSATGSSKTSFSSVFGPEGTSDIITIEVEAGADDGRTVDNRIYSMSGTLMSNGNANTLPKGLYIRNGKKFIVK